MLTNHIPDTWRIEEIDGRIFCYDENGIARCGALKRTDGKPCMNRPSDNGRCVRMHNGNAVSGELHPSFKTGEYTRIRRYMPKRLGDIYDNYTDDIELNDLDPNIKLIDSRIDELLTRLDSGDYGNSYKKINEEFDKLDESVKIGDDVGIFIQMNSLRKLIKDGSKDYQIWSEIVDLNMKRSQLLERKHKILLASENAITINEFTAFLSAMKQAFFEAAQLPTLDARRNHFAQKMNSYLER